MGRKASPVTDRLIRPRARQLSRRSQESIRAGIQGRELVKLLSTHALKGLDIDPSRIDAAKFLLTFVIAKPAQEVISTGDLTIRWKS